ncbi:MAG: hypothetical protein PHC34_09910, partial [Candidatus Gastranaerophilales bacterium]|nr:hypothetical protein [Candidatus Gastranaerophilales bacterium]
KILPWIGNKENPVGLGIITLLLSGLAFLSVLSARKTAKLTNDRKMMIFLGVLLPAVICFTTVGRLWYLPGTLLVIVCSLFAYEFWFGKLKDSSPKLISKNFRIYQIIGIIGCAIILFSIGMAFANNIFGLFKAEVLVNTIYFRFEILPMDIVRSTNLSNMVTKDVEVSLVMIVYIFLILGAFIALLSSLAKSRIFKLAGGVLVFIGLSLFLLTGILGQGGFPSVRFQNIIGSLGLGWYMSIIGMLMIIITNLFEFKEDNNKR